MFCQNCKIVNHLKFHDFAFNGPSFSADKIIVHGTLVLDEGADALLLQAPPSFQPAFPFHRLYLGHAASYLCVLFSLLASTQSVANRSDEFFVIEWFHEKSDRPNSHCRGASGEIFSRGDDNYTSLR
jgi:hypothetical protein